MTILGWFLPYGLEQSQVCEYRANGFTYFSKTSGWYTFSDVLTYFSQNGSFYIFIFLDIIFSYGMDFDECYYVEWPSFAFQPDRFLTHKSYIAVRTTSIGKLYTAHICSSLRDTKFGKGVVQTMPSKTDHNLLPKLFRSELPEFQKGFEIMFGK